MKLGLLALAVLALGVAPALAQDAPDSASEEKKVCKTEKVTGSRTRTQRICMTETQWRELEARTRKGLEEMSQSASGANGPTMAPGPGGT
jgi:hypothetical protein